MRERVRERECERESERESVCERVRVCGIVIERDKTEDCHARGASSRTSTSATYGVTSGPPQVNHSQTAPGPHPTGEDQVLAEHSQTITLNTVELMALPQIQSS